MIVQIKFVVACGFAILILPSAIHVPADAGDEPRELKIFATLGWSNAADDIGPLKCADSQQLVIRSDEELALNTPKGRRDPRSAKDPAFQKESVGQLAKLLKVKEIDWNKQMIVLIWDEANTRGPRGAVGFASLKIKGDELTIKWGLAGNRADMYPRPRGVALVERFNGKVSFSPSLKK